MYRLSKNFVQKNTMIEVKLIIDNESFSYL